MLHRNAPLSELGRLRLARTIVEQGWSQTRAAERFQVSRPTAHRWATRFRDQGRPGWRIGPAALLLTGPHANPSGWQGRASALAPAAGTGPDGPRVGLAASTVQAILVRCRISRLAPLDRATGQPVRRYEHPHPGALVPIDIKKLGNIPAGGGHRFLGRAAGMPNHQATGQVASSAVITTRGKATGSSTPPLMTTPGWPMPRSTPMRPARPRSGSSSGLRPGSLPAAWSSSRC